MLVLGVKKKKEKYYLTYRTATINNKFSCNMELQTNEENAKCTRVLAHVKRTASGSWLQS